MAEPQMLTYKDALKAGYAVQVPSFQGYAYGYYAYLSESQNYWKALSGDNQNSTFGRDVIKNNTPMPVDFWSKGLDTYEKTTNRPNQVKPLILSARGIQTEAQVEATRKQTEIVAARAAEEGRKAAVLQQEVMGRTREGAERSVSRTRARRAGGGLLAAASSPDLTVQPTGPALGGGSIALGGTGSGLGSTSMLGAKLKV
jgi:hypothetical protein